MLNEPAALEKAIVQADFVAPVRHPCSYVQRYWSGPRYGLVRIRPQAATELKKIEAKVFFRVAKLLECLDETDLVVRKLPIKVWFRNIVDVQLDDESLASSAPQHSVEANQASGQPLYHVASSALREVPDKRGLVALPCV